MLTISNHQLAVLQRQAAGGTIRELVAGLRLDHPGETAAIPEAQLMALGAEGFTRALGYGLARTADVAWFLEMMLTCAPDFDRYPPIRFILSDPDIQVGEKVDRVLARMREADWQDLRRRASRAKGG